MAKKANPPTSAKSAQPAPPSPPQRSVLARLRPWVLVVGAGVGLAGYGVQRLQNLLPDLSSREEYQAGLAQIEITPPPRWVPQNFIEQVLHAANLPEKFSLLDDHLAHDIAEAFQLHPWVERVVSVHTSIPAAVRVHLEYRRPAAMIQVAQGMYPIDAQGVLLPPADFSVSDARLYPRVVNVRSTPQGPAGTGWGDPIVAGAARLAEALAPHWKKWQLAAIVCPQEAPSEDSLDQGLYVLTSTGGSRILWGLPPDAKHPGELTTEQKLGKLKKYVDDFGSFDRPRGPYEINIRHWQEIGRQTLTTELETLEIQRQ